jgi:CheY-like chemotaxis protein
VTRDVLVIDDSATVRKLVEISLRGRSLRPHFADSGSDGLRRAIALSPAAILLDFVLPDMTGVDVCRALAADTRTRSIPVLVVTAKPERMRAEFQPFPAVVDFITKPFTGPDLIARIDRAIDRAIGPIAAVAAPGSASIGHRPTPPRRDPVERAAKLLFGRLRDGLALLPSQLRSLEAGPIAPQLARRLLTPQVVEGILADLRPLCAELAELEAKDRGAGDSTAGDRPATDAIVDRAPGFSARLATAQLSSLDRRILALADGRLSIAEIARRIATEPGLVEAAVRGLVASGLLYEAQAGSRARPVVICDPDVETFQEPLRSLLARRATSRELIAVDRLEELVGVTRQRQPCLVMVNATARVAEVCAVAHAVRTELGLSDVAMIAVLEARVVRPPDLLAAGFDAILAKPVMLHELERFLIPLDLR